MSHSLDPMPQNAAYPNSKGRLPSNQREIGASIFRDINLWLLLVSVALSAVLCWMYVNKPVIILSTIDRSTAVDPSTIEMKNEKSDSQVVEPIIANTKNLTESNILPSDNALPGIVQQDQAGVIVSPVKPNSKAISDLKKLQYSSDWNGWEKTNLQMQHVLSANLDGANVQKIVINTPVYYESRTMRWSKKDIAQARDILSRLVVYESNIHKLRLESRSILEDWNEFVQKTIPHQVLRADSPSITNAATQSGLINGDNLIKIEN